MCAAAAYSKMNLIRALSSPRLLQCADYAPNGFLVDLQAPASATAELLLAENAMRERSETIQATLAPIAAM